MACTYRTEIQQITIKCISIHMMREAQKESSNKHHEIYYKIRSDSSLGNKPLSDSLSDEEYSLPRNASIYCFFLFVKISFHFCTSATVLVSLYLVNIYYVMELLVDNSKIYDSTILDSQPLGQHQSYYPISLGL